MKFKEIFVLFFVNLCLCHADQSTPAPNVTPTTVDPNCATNKVDLALLDNPDLGVGGIVFDKPVFSTEGPNGTTRGPGEDPSSTEHQSESSTPSPVTVTAENLASSSGGQNESSTIPGSPTGEESSTPQPTLRTDQPGENPTTDSQSEHSNPASPTPQNPVTVSSENPTSPAGEQNDFSSTPGSPTAPTGQQSSSPQPSLGTDQPEGSTQYYLSTISALLPTTTSSPCTGALCFIQQVFQQLAAQLMAFLQEIFGPLLEALGITNIG
ncbi:hypothetical protein CAEBREN_19985 [Caenorhabditis brenneri]|uniref:Uncharacterized protein n=1 Tax=Caenorhabditis brenneri TaxID=135651 RepID=G0N5X8_CAEBE|nr:hypothetical protein CAEBREN_19985 [Caenorhabditis brenneri]